MVKRPAEQREATDIIGRSRDKRTETKAWENLEIEKGDASRNKDVISKAQGWQYSPSFILHWHTAAMIFLICFLYSDQASLNEYEV